MNLCLNMIVKNEAARIERALDSAAQFIDSWVITDTGSTDGTQDVIKKYFAHHKIPGHVTHAPFIDWSQARNAALLAARTARRRYGFDYLLLMDADMELKVRDATEFLKKKTGPAYDMYQDAGSLHYQNRRLVHADQPGVYLGVTHEFLNVDTAGCIPDSVAYFVDHADGANRPEKFKRDIRLLLDGLKKEPNNERYFFYLAQSYRDAQQPVEAMRWYQRRIDAGGWDEEVWSAQLNLAHCYKDVGNEAEFIRNLLIAYNMRPSRAESLYDLAHHYREKGMNAAAVAIAEGGVNIKLSNDALFVNKYVYEAGLKEELSICSFYVPEKKERGFAITDDLALQAGPYGGSRELARNNLYFYMPRLVDGCPSFHSQQIAFEPPADYVAMNPSVTLHNGVLTAIIRTVNYRMDEEGRYIIKATDGTANASNPINTRNFLVRLGEIEMQPVTKDELLPPGNFPIEFNLVTGFEDMRLFSWDKQLWTSSTVRQLHPDGNCEQVLARIERHFVSPPFIGSDYKRMLRQPRSTEKNWMPIVNREGHLSFMWRLGEVVDTDGNTISKTVPTITTDHISGGSQLVKFMSGYLAVVHEARLLPGSHLRYYFHRFAFFDGDCKLMTLSRPFVFNDKVIEFCAGMCWHPDGKRLVISYGYRDCEARIATVDASEVRNFLWPLPKLK